MKLKGGPKLTEDERKRVKFRAGIENVFLVSGISFFIIFDMVSLNIFVWHQKIIYLTFRLQLEIWLQQDRPCAFCD